MTWLVKRGKQYLYAIVNGDMPIWSQQAVHGMRFEEDAAVEAAVMFDAIAVPEWWEGKR